MNEPNATPMPPAPPPLTADETTPFPFDGAQGKADRPASPPTLEQRISTMELQIDVLGRLALELQNVVRAQHKMVHHATMLASTLLGAAILEIAECYGRPAPPEDETPTGQPGSRLGLLERIKGLVTGKDMPLIRDTLFKHGMVSATDVFALIQPDHLAAMEAIWMEQIAPRTTPPENLPADPPSGTPDSPGPASPSMADPSSQASGSSHPDGDEPLL